MSDRRTFPRADWVRLYGRSFKRISLTMTDRSSDCTHEHALAFEGERRKDGRYAVEVECGCGTKEMYELGVPFGEPQYFQMTVPVPDETVEERDTYEMSRSSFPVMDTASGS